MPYFPVFSHLRDDADWQERIKELWWARGNPDPLRIFTGIHADKARRLLDLRDRLVAIAGHEACLPPSDGHLDLIEARGELWMGRGSRKIAGKACRCHANSLAYWAAHRGDGVVVATGYALTGDGMWRQHTWCVRLGRDGGRVLETTEPRVLYFGTTLTEAETLEWMKREIG